MVLRSGETFGLDWKSTMARILVVDDDDDIRAAMAAFLRDAGHSVLTAAGGRHALELLGGFAADVVVTDMFMPDGEGIETIRGIGAARPSARIVAMSGGGAIGMTDALGYALLLGADRALAKPFGAAELERAIDELLAPAWRHRGAA